MDHAVCFIEARGNDVKVLGVARVVTPEYGICHMIGDLYEPRGPGVHKQRRVGKVSQHAPLGADLSEFTAQPLECGLTRSLVENEQTALWITSLALSRQEQVKALA